MSVIVKVIKSPNENHNVMIPLVTCQSVRKFVVTQSTRYDKT